MNHPRVCILAGALADARGLRPGPLALLVAASPAHSAPAAQVLALGPVDAVRRHPLAQGAAMLDLRDRVLIPGLVNAHTHLDLTALGPTPHDPAQGFVPWIDMIRQRRSTRPEEIARAVARGVALLRAGGTVAVGDIAGAVAGKPSRLAAEALAATGMPGVSFIEYFGLLTPARQLQELLAAAAQPVGGPLRVGLQPHAPYSVSLPGYAIAIDSAVAAGIPMSTHLAESPEERELIVHARGPLRGMLAGILADPAGWIDQFALARSPVAHAMRLPWPKQPPRALAVHVNDCTDEDLRLLAERQAVVVYCPRASAYFGAERHFGPHRYRDMLAAGIPVALGTDSIVNLPPSAADPAAGGISTLDEMRLLFRRDGTDPFQLLAMGTTLGALALNLDPHAFLWPDPAPADDAGTATPHTMAGLVAIAADASAANPWAAALGNDAPPALLWNPHPLPGTSNPTDSAVPTSPDPPPSIH
jgi:cytosine/adenosine deaminase-related metal-dependent hydrolase